MAGVQNHRAWDHTDGGEIKVPCEPLTVLPFFRTSGGDEWGEEEKGEGGGVSWGGSHLQPWHHRLITYHVSPAAPRQARRDRSHLSSLRGSQYNLLCWSDIQRRGVELPNLILQMRTLLFLPSHVLVCRRRWGRGGWHIRSSCCLKATSWINWLSRFHLWCM